MEWRNAIAKIFGGVKRLVRTGTWKEVGIYNAGFTSFGTNIYANEIVRSCIRALSEHSSKANVRVIRRVDANIMPGDKKMERMLQYRPNMYMNGKDFLYKVRTRLEIDNTAFIFIQRDEYGKCIGLYPMPKADYEALESAGNLYILFRFVNGNVVTVHWEDLAVLRKDYNESDIFGDQNTAILTSLELLNTSNEGLGNAIKSTANLRGVLKSTKAMLDPEDVKKQKDSFVADYLNIANEGGIAAIDSSYDFVPIKMEPQVANYKHIEELRNNIYRYFGVNDDILMGKISAETWEAFYESSIEGFLLALSLELTNKAFSDRERGFGNEIVLEANRMQYMKMSDKLALVQMVDRGAMLPNEWRQILNLAPIEGGDVPIRRLDTAPTMIGEVEEVDNEGQEL